MSGSEFVHTTFPVFVSGSGARVSALRAVGIGHLDILVGKRDRVRGGRGVGLSQGARGQGMLDWKLLLLVLVVLVSDMLLHAIRGAMVP